MAVAAALATACSGASDATALPGVAAEPPTPGQETALVVEPSRTAPGGTIAVVPWAGAVQPTAMQGADATLEHEQGGEWRTLWVLVTADLGQAADVPSAFAASPGASITVPGVAYPPDQALRFDLPREVAPGSYRICKSFTGQGRLCGDLEVT